jgi:hypothetical protein
MDIKILHSSLHGSRAFRPTIKFNCDPNYLDVECPTMVASLGYTAKLTAPYTHNQLAKMECSWATLADSTIAMMQNANCPPDTGVSSCAQPSIYVTCFPRPPPLAVPVKFLTRSFMANLSTSPIRTFLAALPTSALRTATHNALP